MPLFRCKRPASSSHARWRLFGNTVLGLEAVHELLAVLVRGVLGEKLAVCGALKGLEAGLALDGLGGGVLSSVRTQASEEATSPCDNL